MNPDPNLQMTPMTRSVAGMPDAPDSKRGGMEGSSSSCWGRIFTSGKLSKQTLFMTASVVGLLFLTIGLIALAGCYAPQTATSDWIKVLHAAHKVTESVASALTTDPILLSMMIFGTGAGLSIGGIAGAMVDRCK